MSPETWKVPKRMPDYETEEVVRLLVDVKLNYNSHRSSRKEAMAEARTLGMRCFGGGSGVSYSVRTGRVREYRGETALRKLVVAVIAAQDTGGKTQQVKANMALRQYVETMK